MTAESGQTALEKLITDHHAGSVDVKVCDLAGRWRQLTLRASTFLEAAKVGVGVDASNYGLATTTKSDASLSFDASRPFLDPFAHGPTVSVIGQLASSRGGVLPEDPRGVARRAEDFLRATGVAEGSLWLPELEFYVYRQDRLALNAYEVASRLAPLGEVEAVDSGALGTAYHLAPPQDRLYGLRSRVASLLEDAGYPVKYHHHEVGSAGQVEIELGMMPLVQAADAILTAKYLARNAAAEEGLVANFMPKPLHGQPGNGLHVHLSLQAADRGNAFAGPGPSGLSRLALQFIGGVLVHADALCALTNPSTNSYRRLMSGHEAPASKSFGAQNRSASIRIPAYAAGRFEYRLMDATVNPYLALAALLMAGLDGVEREIDPQAEGFGPWEGQDEPARAAAGRLPGSLSQALDALERDQEFLLRGGVFPEPLIAAWIKLKRDECARLNDWPHPWEFVTYGGL